MKLTKTISDISSGWLNYRKHCIAKSKTGITIRVKKPHEIKDLIEIDWQSIISERLNTDKYIIDASVGDGNLAAIPWLAIMEKGITSSVRNGYFVVFLFSRSTSKLYLSLGIGATQFQEIYNKNQKCIDEIKLAADTFRNQFKDYFKGYSYKNIDLLEDNLTFEEPLKGSSRNLVSCYQAGTIINEVYDVNDLDEKKIYSDLDNYVDIYEKIINDPLSDTIEFLAERNLANKETIKSSDFDYKVSLFTAREPKKKKKTKHLNKTNTKNIEVKNQGNRRKGRKWN